MEDGKENTMLYNPQDIMPDKMMDKEVLGKFNWKFLLLISLILLLFILGIREYLKNSTEEFGDIKESYTYYDGEEYK